MNGWKTNRELTDALTTLGQNPDVRSWALQQVREIGKDAECIVGLRLSCWEISNLVLEVRVDETDFWVHAPINQISFLTIESVMEWIGEVRLEFEGFYGCAGKRCVVFKDHEWNGELLMFIG